MPQTSRFGRGGTSQSSVLSAHSSTSVQPPSCKFRHSKSQLHQPGSKLPAPSAALILAPRIRTASIN